MKIVCRGVSAPLAAIGFFLASIIASQAQKTIHVPADVPNIQTAISNASNGDTVLVSPGTYFENFDFSGKAITVESTGGPAVTVVDARGLFGVVTFTSGEGPQSILRGFTLMNGSWFQGGGIQIVGASPTIENNIITRNFAGNGAGISAETSSAIIRNNTISSNFPEFPSRGGAGVFIDGPGSVQLLNNTITGNALGSGGDGAGVLVDAASTPLIAGNVIENNSSPSGNGGGLLVSGSAVVVNNVIAGNSAMFNGGGIYTFLNGAPPSFVNNTIAGNSAVQGSQFYIDGVNANAEIANNLMIDFNGTGAVFCGSFSGQIPTFDHNDVYSSSAATGQVQPYGGACSDVTGVSGNIQADPQFVDPVSGNFHLQISSPALDAGNNAAPSLSPLDRDGNPRVAFGSATTCSNSVDIGAYEFVLTTAPSATLTPASLDFGIQRVGTMSAFQSFTLTGTQGCVTTQSVATTGDFSQTNNCSSVLATGASCVVQVSFRPLLGGLRSGSLSVSGNTGTLSSSLTGQGGAAIAGVSPASLAFGSQPIQTHSTTQTLTLTNSGNIPLQISGISISGPFSQTNNCPAALSPATSCIIQVTFTPTNLGAASGSLVVTDDDPATAQQTVAFSGTGVDYSVTASPASVTVKRGSTALYNTTIAPLGGSFVGPVTLSCGGLPAATTCSFSPLSGFPGAGSASSTLSLTTSSGQHGTDKTPSGTYTVTITGSSASLTHSTTVRLVVQ